MALVARVTPASAFTLSIWKYLDNHYSPISFETKKLLIRAVAMEDKPFFQMLFVNVQVMRNFTDHEARHRDLTKDQWEQQQFEAADKRLVQLVERWKGGDPFSGFVIIDKKSGEPRAHVTAGHTNPPTPGITEIAYMVPPERWHQGYGTLAFKFIQHYLEMLTLIYRTWSGGLPLQIDGAPLRGFMAVSRTDNKYSIQILKKKMKKRGNAEKWNLRLVVYHLPVNTPKPKL